MDDFSSIGQKDKSRPATVVSVLLGYDTLMVYLSNVPVLTSDLRHLTGRSMCITDEELYALLAKPGSEHNLFTTSTESGTFDIYASLLRRTDSTMILEDLDRGQFFDNTDLVTLRDNGRPYILLGACDYPVAALDDDVATGKCLMLPVVDHNSGKTIIKPHYVYFVAYPTEKEDERQISPNVIEFLRRLGVSTGTKIRKSRIRVRDTCVLVPLDSLVDWHR